MFKPSEISRKLNISTSSLRYYESNGLVPKSHRDSNNYRMYDHRHIAYFEAVQAMSLGFKINVVSSVMKDVQNHYIEKALWSINEVQVQNREEYQLLNFLKEKIENRSSYCEEMIRVGKIAELLGISTTALRYWEREGLIVSTRESENNYRYYREEEFVKAGILKILQGVNYSKHTVEMKNEMKCANNHLQKLNGLLDQCQKLIDKRNHDQMQGIHYLYEVIRYFQD